MKIMLVLFVLLQQTLNYGQTKTIKIKKELSQDRMTSVVTIGGLYYGETSPKKLLADGKLRVSNNTDHWKIISFTIIIGGKGNLKSYSQSTDSLTPQILEELLRRDLKEYTKLYISPTRAVNSRQDTMVLNPIELKLVAD